MRIESVAQTYNAELRKVESSKKAEKDQKSSKVQSSDRSEFSANAQRLSETKAQAQAIASSVAAQPEVRTEKIAEVKAKIENGYYDSPEFIDKLADKLMSEFGLNQS